MRAAALSTLDTRLPPVSTKAMKPATIGMAGGMMAAIGVTRFMSGLLYSVRPADSATLASATLFLGAIALVACQAPARRATIVDPLIALRQE